MARPPLEFRTLLDPRPGIDAAREPIANAVNIPLAELPERTHELPPRDAVIPVAGPEPIALQAVQWLIDHGRHAVWHRAPQQTHTDPGLTANGPGHGRDSVGRLWRPSPLVQSIAPQIPAGRALELACGSGRDAVYLASLGWEVTAIDILPDALARAADLAERCRDAIVPIEWQLADLRREELGFDHPFDLVVMIRYLHRPLFDRFAEWLRPSGHALIETFTTTHRNHHGRPASDADVLAPGELSQLLSGWELEYCNEDWVGQNHVAQVWARSPS